MSSRSLSRLRWSRPVSVSSHRLRPEGRPHRVGGVRTKALRVLWNLRTEGEKKWDIEVFFHRVRVDKDRRQRAAA